MQTQNFIARRIPLNVTVRDASGHTFQPISNSIEEQSDGESSDNDEEDDEFQRRCAAPGIIEIDEEQLGLQLPNSSRDATGKLLNTISSVPSNVSFLQQKAARYILMSGISAKGLSIKGTGEYLDSLDENGEVRRLWPNKESFWADHAKRQSCILPSFGAWRKVKMDAVNHSAGHTVPNYYAIVRYLPETIKSVVENAKRLQLEKFQSWSKVISWEPTYCLGSNGERIVHDFYSSDDLIYLWQALKLQPGHSESSFLPSQLFIDKANVTKLNKRSMYPVVLYLLCFSRTVRRKLAVNVAFIPVVSRMSKSGGRLSTALTKLVRCSVVQETLQLLLEPLTAKLTQTCTFPEGKTRKSTPVLFSIVADLPEVAMLQSMRYGSQAYFPCCRCTVSQSELGKLVLGNDVIPRRVEDLQQAYESLMTLKTKKSRESYLKEHGLRLPKSALLKRFEFSLDVENIQRVLRSNNSIWRESPPFGLPSVTRFESLHNFDLGITADLLRGIGKFFAMTLTPTAANVIVTTANTHQSMLPRRSDTRSFRLPSPGSTIAESHANVNATQYKSALCVLPFFLCGATRCIKCESY